MGEFSHNKKRKVKISLNSLKYSAVSDGSSKFGF
jgi:hypothetical protein